MQVVFLIFLFVLGACVGSFLCCQARRLHLRQRGSKKKLGSRSVCLHCGVQLKWYDNLPIISWLMLGGKCRKCHKKIGLAELFSELGVALAFLVLGLNIEYGGINVVLTSQPLFIWMQFVVQLIFVTILAFLAIYDGLYGELPVNYLVLSIVWAAILLGVNIWITISGLSFRTELIWEPLASVAILGGLYLVLYLVSKGKWVGDGDWLLGIAIGLALASPWLSLIAVFVANVLACIVMAPFVIKRKNTKIYFGPFLVIAYVIVIVLSTVL